MITNRTPVFHFYVAIDTKVAYCLMVSTYVYSNIDFSTSILPDNICGIGNLICIKKSYITCITKKFT